MPYVLDEFKEKSTKRLYQRDPEAFVSDVLDKRWHQKQREVANSFLTNTRTAVKSANGCGKSDVVSDLILWTIAVNEPGDTLCLLTAPSLQQIGSIIMPFLKTGKQVAASNGFILPGDVREDLTWKCDGPQGSVELVRGKRPADKDIVSTFQGVRGKYRTNVFMDEAGGLPEDLFVGAEAVTTQEGSRIIGIGNPDRTGTYFHRIFTDDNLGKLWSRQTISAFDLPTFTGEIVYEDSERQSNLLRVLTTPEKVEERRLMWGEGSARWQSKVLGEFPDAADDSLFPQSTIDKAFDNTIEPDEDERPVLGLDVARYGADSTQLYINVGGKIRRYNDGNPDSGQWSKTDLITTARRAHQAAQSTNAKLINVDANGVGSGVVDALLTLNEFNDAMYDVGAIFTANSSSDNTRWLNQRAELYDTFRQKMQDGLIDLDYDDTDLREQLISSTFKFSSRGSLQITSKEDMRKRGLSSPDSLDAVLLSTFSVETVEGPQVGEVVEYEPVREHAFYSESFW
jgi:hypothetical protein